MWFAFVMWCVHVDFFQNWLFIYLGVKIKICWYDQIIGSSWDALLLLCWTFVMPLIKTEEIRLTKEYYNHTRCPKKMNNYLSLRRKIKSMDMSKYFVSWIVLPLGCGAYVELYYPNLIDQAMLGAQKCKMALFWAKMRYMDMTKM